MISAPAGGASASMLTPAAPAASAYVLSRCEVDWERCDVLCGRRDRFITPPWWDYIVLPAESGVNGGASPIVKRVSKPAQPRAVLRFPRLVAFAQSMPLAATFAQRRRLRIVHQVMHRLQGAQICEHGFKVIVRHIAVDGPGHWRLQFARPHGTAADGLDEQCLGVISDAGSIGRDVGGGHSVLEDRAACKLHPLDGTNIRRWRRRRVATATDPH